MKIAVVGLGYVGSTLAVMLSKHHDVFALDFNREKVDAINNRRSPINDKTMDRVLRGEVINLTATVNPKEAYNGAEYIVIATNTELDDTKGVLNTTSIESVLDELPSYGNYMQADRGSNPVVVIKSTVPIGYTKRLMGKYPQFSFLYCPEFLREKTAMEDVLKPSRVIVGYDVEEDKKHAEAFAEAVLGCVDASETPLVFTTTEEAEAIKLFSNSYLAIRIAFFNELDTFACSHGLDTNRIIKGVCLDPRIGDWYNVPGPGFGGHCLPKDTQQLVSDFGELPETLIRAAIEANSLRKTNLENK